jgi:DNA-binding transcriptional MocR family regulator
MHAKKLDKSLKQQIIEMVLTGIEECDSVNEYANRVGISRNTVLAALDESVKVQPRTMAKIFSYDKKAKERRA